jgi:hypothetical protein
MTLPILPDNDWVRNDYRVPWRSDDLEYHQNEDNRNDKTQNAAGAIAPIAGIGPRWECPKKEKK